jgi:medium-chain acyl-[acyl-carrier-protein] hydrolase
MIIHERNYSINIYETGINGKLSLVSLFDLFQDIAGRHASALGFGREHLMINRNFWVLSRISARINKMPDHWDEVILRTWPRGTDGIFAIRDLEVLSPSGEKLIVATSSWVVVDFDSRRLQRPDRALSILNVEFPKEKTMEENAIKINPLPVKDNSTKDLAVSISDLDINLHVNNATYIRWICDTYTPEFINSHTPQSIDVNYVSEGHFGDNICITTAPDEEHKTTFYHSVKRKDDNVELCRLWLKWKENS